MWAVTIFLIYGRFIFKKIVTAHRFKDIRQSGNACNSILCLSWLACGWGKKLSFLKKLFARSVAACVGCELANKNKKYKEDRESEGNEPTTKQSTSIEKNLSNKGSGFLKSKIFYPNNIPQQPKCLMQLRNSEDSFLL